MKSIKYILAAIVVLNLAACKKDNLKEPTSSITGRVIFKDQPIGVRTNGIQFEIWQSGYQLFTRIPLNIRHDGTFSAVLFDGDYKIVRARGAGPWTDNSDTINVKLNGSTTLDIPVEPFFSISNPVFEKVGSTIKATFTVDRNNATRTLELARLYVGPNLILDQNNNGANVQVAPTAITPGTPVSVTVTIPAAIANDNFIYARVGVKTTGVAELIYTQSTKVMLK